VRKLFKIYDGRENFYQWDLNRKLIVEDSSIKEVHFSNRMSDNALVCEVYTDNGLTLVNVPNILLQQSYAVNVYAYDGESTKHSASFDVKPRTKPTDYVYTETEVKKWEDLEKKIEDLANKPSAPSADEVFNPTSKNAQSGIAVAAAIKNTEKHYSTTLSIAEVNKKEINYKGSIITPLVFDIHKSLLGNKNQIIIRLNLIPSFVYTATGEEIITFSHMPKDLNKITSTLLGIEIDGDTALLSWEELEDMFISSLPSDSFIKHYVNVNENNGTFNYLYYKEELWIETADVATSDAMYAELESLFSLISKMVVNYNEYETDTQEGEWLYD
jgi:hypothetical protein